MTLNSLMKMKSLMTLQSFKFPSWAKSLRFAILFPLALAILGVSLFQMVRWNQQTGEFLEDWGNDNAADFVGSIHIALETIPEKDWPRFVKAMAASRKINSIQVAVKDPMVITLSTESPLNGRAMESVIPPQYKDSINQILSSEISFFSWVEPGNRHYLFPLRIDSQQTSLGQHNQGLIYLVLDDTQTQAHIRETRRSSLVSFFILLGLLLGVGLWVLQANLFREMDGIKEVLGLWAKGQTEKRITIRSASEIGQIAQTLNQTMENLSQTTGRLKLVMESTKDGIFDFNQKTGEIFFSPQAVNLFECPVEEIPLKRKEVVEKLLHPDHEEIKKALLDERKLAELDTSHFEVPIQTSTGKKKWLMFRGTPIPGGVGQSGSEETGRRLGLISDITDLKNAQLDAEENARRLDLVLEAANHGTWDWDILSGKAIVSRQFAEMLGYDFQGFNETFDSWKARIHPADLPYTLKTFEDYAAGKIPNFQVDFRAQNKNGKWKWLHSQGAITAVDGSGKPIRMMGTHSDITESMRLRLRDKVRLEILEKQKSKVQLSQVLKVLCQYALTENPTSLMGVFLPKQNPDELVLVNPEDFPESLLGIFKSFSLNDKDHFIANVAREKKRQWITDLRQLSPRDPVCESILQSGFQSGWLEPISGNDGQSLGLLLWLHPYSIPPQAKDFEEMAFLVQKSRMIIESQQSLEALEEREKQFRKLVENAPEPIFIQTNWHFAYLNHAALLLFKGKNFEELLGQPVLDRFTPKYRDTIRERIRKLNEDKLKASILEEEILCLDGTTCTVETSAVPFRFQGHDGALVFLRDISERKKAPQKILQSEIRFRAIFDGVDEGIVVTDTQKEVILYANPGFHRIFGYKLGEMAGISITQLHPPSALPVVDRHMRMAIEQKSTITMDVPCVKKDGQLIDCRIRPTLTAIDGNPALVVFFSDISESNKIVKELKSSESNLAEAQKLARIGSFEWNITSNQLTWSAVLYDILGLSPEITPSIEAFFGVLSPQDLRRVETWISRVSRGDEVEPIEFEVAQPHEGLKGTKLIPETLQESNHHLMARAKCIKNGEGAIIQVLGTIQDVTQDYLLKDALKQNNELFESLFSSYTVGLTITNINKKQILRANPAFLQMLGYRAQDLPLSWEGMTPPEWGELDTRAVEMLVQGFQVPPWEKEYFRKDGTRCPILLGVTPLTGQADRQICFVLDITDRKNKEREIARKSWEVGERIKELHCVYTVSQIFETFERPIPELITEAVKAIGPAFQFPMIAVAQIDFRGQVYANHPSQPMVWELSQSIEVEGKTEGKITVGYTSPIPFNEFCQEAFLKEEVDLLRTLGKMIGTRIAAHETKTDLEKSQKRFQTIFDTSPHGIILAEPETTNLVSGNPAFLEMFGIPNQDVLKTLGVSDLHPQEALPGILKEFQRMEAGNLSPVNDTLCKKSDGTLFRSDIHPGVMVLEGKPTLVAYFTNVTDNYNSRIDMENSRKELIRAQEMAGMGGWIYDVVANELHASPQYRKLLNWPAEILTRNDIQKMVHIDDKPSFVYCWKKAKEGIPFDNELRLVIDGVVKWFHTIAEPRRDASGKVAEVIGIAQDITKSKKSEEQLQYQADLLKETGRIAQVGGWGFRVESGSGYWAEIVSDIFEWEQTFTPNLQEVMPCFIGSSKELSEKALEEAVTLQKMFDVELEIRTFKGNQKWVRIIGHPILEKGIVVQIHGTVQDITHRIRDRLALDRERSLLQAILTNMPDPLWLKDEKGVYLFYNERFTQLFGRQEQEILGLTDFDISPKSNAQHFSTRDKEALSQKLPIVYEEWRTFAMDGHRELLEIRKVATYDLNGNLIGILGLGKDITSQKLAKDTLVRFNSELEERVQKRTSELAERTKEFELVVNSLPDTVLRINDEGKVLFCKKTTDSLDSFTTICSKNGCMNVGCTACSLISEAVKVGRVARGTGKTAISEKEFAGTILELRIAPLAEGDFLVLVRDISARRRLEEDTKSALKKEKEIAEMRSRFISVASHEFRTPMAAVAGSVDLLQNFNDRITPTKRAELLDRIVNGVNRLKSIVDDVLTLSRVDAGRTPVSKAWADLGMFFRDVMGEAEVGDRNTHRFDLAVIGPVDRVYTDTKLLHHILSNMLSNAIRYSPKDTTIRIELNRGDASFSFKVQDEGIGIPEADRAHLFEAFYRAGNVGQISGTGLGLNIVKRYCEMLGGKVELLPSEKGACFQVTFPIEPGPALEKGSGPENGSEGGGAPRMLDAIMGNAPGASAGPK